MTESDVTNNSTPPAEDPSEGSDGTAGSEGLAGDAGTSDSEELSGVDPQAANPDDTSDRIHDSNA